MKERTSHLHTLISVNFQQTHTKKEAEEDREEVKEDLSKHEKMLEDLKNRIQKQGRSIDLHTRTLGIKVDMEELTELKELVMELPKADDIQKMKLYLQDHINAFTDDNN